MRELALFAGAGGGILGGKLLGWRTVCAVEIDAYCTAILASRQDDGLLPAFPIWDDVRTFDGKPWRGIVDVVSGGFPCQDISAAGKRVGIKGSRSGLWSEFARIIGEVRPRFAFIENSADLAFRGLDRVLADLAAMGMDARWGVFSACSIGAPHPRERLWIVAYPMPTGERRQPRQSQVETEDVPDASGRRARQLRRPKRPEKGQTGWDVYWATDQPPVARVADGVADRLDRCRAVGNGQVPAVVRLAWEALKP